MTSYRVQVWRSDHWMTIWRGLSLAKARMLCKWYQEKFVSNFRIAFA